VTDYVELFRSRPGREARFWQKVDKSAGCWLWTGNKLPSGYGTFRMRPGSMYYAHRLSWAIHYGPIPIGVYVCHKCDNPSCVRPEHLFLGSNSDNIRDSIRKGRFPVGERCARSKLSLDDVAAIRASGEPGAALASRYRVTTATISRVRNGQCYRDGD
jgi:hypothetical protein